MHEAGDHGHHHQHHGGQRVDAERPHGFQIARVDEAQQLDPLLLAVDGNLVEGEPGQERGDQDQRGGDDLGRARADEAAEKTCEERADQREEQNRLIHRALSVSP